MILYHPYAETLTDHPRLAATWHFLQDHEAALVARGWNILHQPCGQDTRYEDALKALWTQDDLVILEHDLVPSLGDLLALEPAHHPLCAQAYNLYADATRWQSIGDAMPLAAEALRERPTDRLTQEAYALCAQAYSLWHQSYRPDPRSPRRYFASCAHRHVRADGSHRWITPQDAWSDLAGFGLLRITQAFQEAHPPEWRMGPWNNLDTRFSEWVHGLGVPFHIHWPLIPHHHHCPCHEQAD